MADTRREEIITNEASDRMLNRVTPIYDNARVVLWLFEALGQEWQSMWEAIEQIPDQLFPETATWSLPLWERRYGITPDAGDSDEVRRGRILSKQAHTSGFNPAALEQYIENTLSNVTCEVTDSADAPYTFAVRITARGTVDGSLTDVIRHIQKNKPSHLSFDMAIEPKETLVLASTGFALIDYGLQCGNFAAGAEDEL